MSDNDIRYFLRKMPYTVRVGNIPGGMSEFITIQAAINYCVTQVPIASSRWTVLVWPGTYTENITMAQYVDVVGMDKDSVVINVVNSTGVIMGDNSRLSGLTINALATTAGAAYAIELGDALECRIEDVNIYIDRDVTGGLECVGICEDTNQTGTNVYIRNVRIMCEQVVNTNTRAISIRRNNKTVYMEECYVQGSDYGLELIAASTVESFSCFYECTSAIARALFLNDAGAVLNLHGDIALGITVTAGLVTGTPQVFIPVPNPSGSIGTHSAEQLTDGLDVISRLEFLVPDDFHQVYQAQMLIIPLAAGNLRRTFTGNWGEVCTAENYNHHTDTIAAGQEAVTINDINCIDVSGALNGINPNDLVGMSFTREASNVLDTIGANCWLLGLRFRYV